ncbi:tubulin polyglutamylase TTLL11 [Xenopus laevis]|uniref:Tubulin polyglutamylase TTLL11 n=2 Tax=Xenopus laevis TaxID=8355 RepID=A0A974C5T8_XENLA|nr:tubulin polyglutamylase TTLL11 [Xenopus laevis]OCT67078.1 hypothetical protein XELAEV_18038359mg [Xenopus laevis]
MSGKGMGDRVGGEANREMIGGLGQDGALQWVTDGRKQEGADHRDPDEIREGADHRDPDEIREEGADHRDPDEIREEGADHRDPDEIREEGAAVGDAQAVRQEWAGPCGEREGRALEAGYYPVGNTELRIKIEERLELKVACGDIAGQRVGLTQKGTEMGVTDGLKHKETAEERIRETEEVPGQCLTVKAAQLRPLKVGHEILKPASGVLGKAAECKGNKYSGTQEAVCSFSVRSGPWLVSGQHETRRSTKFNKRREGSAERQDQKTKDVYNRLSASRGTSCPPTTRKKSEHRVAESKATRLSSRGPPQQEIKSNQKKAEGRGNKKQVTVDSSKAKTSLEALKMSIKQLKWKEFPMGRRLPCDIYWHGVSFHESDNLSSGQVNKFPGMTEMVRKINLSRAVRTMQELYPEEYNFYPQSWILPEEYHLFVAQVRLGKENDPAWRPTFIVKPDGGCQGDGIYLIKDPTEVRTMGSLQNRPSVVQEYITKPLLIDKLKFDIRLYVLLKSIEPLEIYIAKDGLSRFCTEPYQEPNHKNLHHVYMHLTNYSLNVHSGNYIHSDSMHTGSKRTFSSVLYRLSAKGLDVKKVWSDIISLVIKTILALIPELKVYYQADIPPGKPGPTCFQILGFDILLMKNLKPVLLEVNANPSMKIDHEQELLPGVYEHVQSLVDEEVKIAVIRDTLRLMDPARTRFSSNESSPSESASETTRGLYMESTDPAEINKLLESSLPSNSLKQVFPKYSKQFNYLRVVERVASIFLRFLGIKGTMKLGPTGFRTFIRSCKLSNTNFSMASVDILYIDITRRWSSMGLDQRESGMCLQAFVEAFFYLAQRRFKGLPLQEQVQSLISLCETHLESLDEKRLLCSRPQALSYSLHNDLHFTSCVPRLNCTSTACKLTNYKLQHS